MNLVCTLNARRKAFSSARAAGTVRAVCSFVSKKASHTPTAHTYHNNESVSILLRNRSCQPSSAIVYQNVRRSEQETQCAGVKNEELRNGIMYIYMKTLNASIVVTYTPCTFTLPFANAMVTLAVTVVGCQENRATICLETTGNMVVAVCWQWICALCMCEFSNETEWNPKSRLLCKRECLICILYNVFHGILNFWTVHIRLFCFVVVRCTCNVSIVYITNERWCIFYVFREWEYNEDVTMCWWHTHIVAHAYYVCMLF